jgi:membrane associated rhomboid family serine protease
MDPAPPEGGPPLPPPPPTPVGSPWPATYRPSPSAEPRPVEGQGLETCYRHPKVTTGVHCTRCGRPICTECMTEAAVGYQCPECLKEAGVTVSRRRSTLTVGGTGAATRILIIANVAMFAVELLTGASSLFNVNSARKLFDLGAMVPVAVANGQYWRLVTVMFLHAGLIHLLFNMYALYLFGTVIERAFGTRQFLILYFLSGFLASVASYLFGPPLAPAVGASGAVFGLLGAWVAYNFRRRDTAFGAYQLRWALLMIGLNLVIGFSLAGIDNAAHIGGLVAGVACGAVLEGFGPEGTRRTVRILGLCALLAIGVIAVAWRTNELQPLVTQFFGAG